MSERLVEPRTEDDRKEDARYLNSLHVANRFRLMFGLPLFPEEDLPEQKDKP